MKKLILTIAVFVAVAFTILAGSADASAGGWRRRRAPVTCAPAPPAMVAQSQAGTGYRTYSYQPAPTYRYAPAYTPSMRGPSRTPSGFGDATRKALGNS